MRWPAVVACSLFIQCCLLPAARAGDWRGGRYGARPAHLGVVADLPYEVTHFNHEPVEPLARSDMPGNFTWCDPVGAKNRCAPSWNQHIPQYCGACFLHGTLSMVQDRLAIMKGGGSPVMLSRQTFLNCAPFANLSGGCDGGDVIDVLRWMRKEGLPDETCMIYEANDWNKYLAGGAKATKCPPEGRCRNCMPLETPAKDVSQDVCWPVKKPLTYSLAAYGKIDGCGELAMMREIYQRGPITCSMAAEAPFTYGYRGGVYTGPNATDVDHDVEVVGWGVEAGEPYWHVRNSWGTFFGELGFFKLQRGKNQLMLEACDCWYANPTWDMEGEVLSGKLGGSMAGLVETGTRAAASPAERAQSKLLRSALRGAQA